MGVDVIVYITVFCFTDFANEPKIYCKYVYMANWGKDGLVCRPTLVLLIKKSTYMCFRGIFMDYMLILQCEGKLTIWASTFFLFLQRLCEGGVV